MTTTAPSSSVSNRVDSSFSSKRALRVYCKSRAVVPRNSLNLCVRLGEEEPCRVIKSSLYVLARALSRVGASSILAGFQQAGLLLLCSVLATAKCVISSCMYGRLDEKTSRLG